MLSKSCFRLLSFNQYIALIFISFILKLAGGIAITIVYKNPAKKHRKLWKCIGGILIFEASFFFVGCGLLSAILFSSAKERRNKIFNEGEYYDGLPWLSDDYNGGDFCVDGINYKEIREYFANTSYFKNNVTLTPKYCFKTACYGGHYGYNFFSFENEGNFDIVTQSHFENFCIREDQYNDFESYYSTRWTNWTYDVENLQNPDFDERNKSLCELDCKTLGESFDKIKQVNELKDPKNEKFDTEVKTELFEVDPTKSFIITLHVASSDYLFENTKNSFSYVWSLEGCYHLITRSQEKIEVYVDTLGVTDILRNIDVVIRH